MRKPRERIQLIGLALAAVAAWGIAVYFSLTRRSEEVSPVADPAPGAATGSSNGSGTSGVAPGTASRADPGAHRVSSSGTPPVVSGTSVGGDGGAASPTAASASTAATGQGEAAVPSAADPTGCVKALFAPDAFLHGQTDFSFICTDPYPRTGITRVQAQVVLGRGSTGQMTDGMREWATLGWYQLAAYALFRGRCCSSPPELDWTFDLACPLDEAAVDVERAVAANDAAALEQALERYTKEARCITKLGQAANFGQSSLPGQGMNSLRKVLERMRKASAD